MPELTPEERPHLDQLAHAARQFEQQFPTDFSNRVRLRHRGGPKQMGKGPTQYPRIVRADSSDEELYYEKRKKPPPHAVEVEFKRRRAYRTAFPHQPSPDYNPLFIVSS